MGSNLLLVCNYRSLYGGNFIPSLMALENKLLERKVTCIYVFPTEAGKRYWMQELCRTGRTVVLINFDSSRSAFCSQLSEIVYKYHISYVYSHFVSEFKIELLKRECKGLVAYAHIHSDFSAGKKTLKEKIIRFLIYKVFSRGMMFFSVNKAFVEYNPKKIKYIPNALATERILCEHVSGPEMRRKIGIDEKEVLCEIYGWAPYIKGVDIAIQAIERLRREKDFPIKLGVVCGREMTTEKMKSWLESFTGFNNIEEYVVMLPSREDVFAYHEAADILISASRSEGFSYAILEMLSLGKSCVISDIPGVSWAKGYSTCVTFHSENIDECCAALCRTIENGCKIDSEVSKQILSEYSIDKWTSDIVENMHLLN